MSIRDDEYVWTCGDTVFRIRPQMLRAIRRYIGGRRPVGGFLSAVICNDLREAVFRADDENLANLPAFVFYFYNNTPPKCWGSPEKMKAWMEAKREQLPTKPKEL